ncbi:P-loop NTPase fold protein [Streptomyces sp. NPDC088354]|uniref:P-loop NTPase fold protein n=1 Tax=unclassified Streptomyces TaxID=2593676 RepID=UPI0029BAE765|nr:P-loop NTPase fold protein [Streptomyces sp. MI02-7b]MDX3072048.1 P-loop NTPase fold protein [Streptomyces sp. MI02-7b]
MFSLLNDEPVATAGDDLLGTGGAARQLARLLIDSRGSTPLTLAVDAGWGMGKSSLMRLVDAELSGTADVHTVWYNAWTSRGADALEGLIKSVLAQFDRRLLRRALHRATEHRVLLRTLRAGTALLAGPLGAAGLVDELWRSLSADAQARNDMRDALRDLAAQWAQTAEHAPRRLLVVFIDDLDRCSEETVLAVCEAVKVYLDVPGLAFVIGCDRSALSPGGLLGDLSPAGSAFMEKIFQTNYRVPPPDDIEAYVRGCAARAGIGDLLDGPHIALLAERTGRNPRRVKRLLNGFVLEAGLNPLWRDFGPEVMLRTLLLQHLYGDFHRVLVSGRGGDAIQEFLDYRAVRRLLRAPAPLTGQGSELVRRLLTEHEVPLAADPAPQDRTRALAELERRLPPAFVALVGDRGFTSLVDDLVRMPEAAGLIRRLRRSPRAAAVTTVELDEERAPQAAPEPPEPGPYTGLSVLWIDDNPHTVSSEVHALRSRGARVEVVEDRAGAEEWLRAAAPDLLLSDIGRHGDPQAGFTDLEHLRGTGRYTGPALFYTGWVAPEREERARQAGALGVAAEPAALYGLIDRMLRQPGAVPSVPPARPSAGRPR